MARPAPSDGMTTADARLQRLGPWFALGVAVVVRLVHVMAMTASPSFDLPLVDSEVYDRAARQLASGLITGDALFYQAPAYPAFLAVVYLLSSGSILAAKLVQAVLGGVTAGLTARLGGEVCGPRCGLAAGLAVALYAPLAFFEGELLATGLAAFLAVTLVLVAARVGTRPTPLGGAVVGALAALAIATRPTFVPFVAALLVWLAIRAGRGRWSTPAAAAAALVVVLAPVGAVTAVHTGEVHVLPASGGLNLYLGNNPDPCATLAIRPGREWNALLERPRLEGQTGLWEENRYFREQVAGFVRERPLAFAQGLAAKTVQLVSSREIPRNLDPLLFREWSPLMWAGAWRVGPWGFPAGVLLPLAAVGVVLGWRRLPVPARLLLVLYPAAVVLVFVAARYRAPLVPVATVAAVLGVHELARAVRDRRRRTVAAGLAVAAAAVLVSTIPGRFCHELDLEGEYWYLVGTRSVLEGRTGGAERALRTAAAADPDHYETRVVLARLLSDQGRDDDAVPVLHEAVAIDPDDPLGVSELGFALARLGRLEEAAAAFTAAARLAPGDPDVRGAAGATLARLGRLEEALPHLEAAVRLDPGSDPARRNLAAARRELASHGPAPSAP